MISWKEAGATSKLITIFTGVFLVSLGMCGFTLRTGMGQMQAGLIEILLILISAFGLVITLIVAFIHATITGRGSRPQTLFGDRDDKK